MTKVCRTIVIFPLLYLAIWVVPITSAVAAEAPVKEVVTAQFGWNADKTKELQTAPQFERNQCTVASKDLCHQSARSSDAGGFEFPDGVAVDTSSTSSHYGDVYIADAGNHRIQELTQTGDFVAVYGWDVNETKVKAGGTEAEDNVCTAVSKDECGTGREATETEGAPGRFGSLESIAIDPTNGDLYLAERLGGKAGVGERIQKLTPGGAFLLEIGKDVNGGTNGNVCTEEEASMGVECTVPEEHSPSSTGTEPLSFGTQAVLATGGEEDLLYVGEEHKVKEFDASGVAKQEIALSSRVDALTVDSGGHVYLVCDGLEGAGRDTILKAEPDGEEVHSSQWPLTLAPRADRADIANFGVLGLAIDSHGRLAVSEIEAVYRDPIGVQYTPFGAILNGENGHLRTNFTTEFESEEKSAFASSNYWVSDLGFSDSGALYGIADSEVVAYTPVRVAEGKVEAAKCSEGTVKESDVTFNCELRGEVDPWGVRGTQVWFEWGNTAILHNKTSAEPISNTKSVGEEEAPVSVAGVIQGLLPDEAANYHYRLAAYDDNVMAPEDPLTSEEVALQTQTVPPRIIGELSASFVSPSSAVLFGKLNPENANTEYLFEYGPCTSLVGCGEIQKTRALNSAAYGKVGTTVEVAGLQPGTIYAYRLSAVNDHSQVALNGVGGAELPEGTFNTLSAPRPQAITGALSAVGSTSAVISGMVDPDGASAVYTFELGPYEGASTQYVVVFSGTAGAGMDFVERTLALSGLQPGTTYAYRITAKSGLGTVPGAPMIFTTLELRSILTAPVVLAQLPVPSVSFPVEAKAPKCKRGYTRDKRDRCVVKHKTRTKGRRGKESAREEEIGP